MRSIEASPSSSEASEDEEEIEVENPTVDINRNRKRISAAILDLSLVDENSSVGFGVSAKDTSYTDNRSTVSPALLKRMIEEMHIMQMQRSEADDVRFRKNGLNSHTITESSPPFKSSAKYLRGHEENVREKRDMKKTIKDTIYSQQQSVHIEKKTKPRKQRGHEADSHIQPGNRSKRHIQVIVLLYYLPY